MMPLYWSSFVAAWGGMPDGRRIDIAGKLIGRDPVIDDTAAHTQPLRGGCA